jgi:hypothetical protein
MGTWGSEAVGQRGPGAVSQRALRRDSVGQWVSGHMGQ